MEREKSQGRENVSVCAPRARSGRKRGERGGEKETWRGKEGKERLEARRSELEAETRKWVRGAGRGRGAPPAPSPAGAQPARAPDGGEPERNHRSGSSSR